jgi:hypothetical protein
MSVGCQVTQEVLDQQALASLNATAFTEWTTLNVRTWLTHKVKRLGCPLDPLPVAASVPRQR